MNGRRSPPSSLDRTGIAVGHERPGGVHLCLSDAELEERRARMEQMRAEAGNFGFDYRMLGRGRTARHAAGDRAVGGRRVVDAL